MPEFAGSVKLLTDVGSILTGSHYWSPEGNQEGKSGLFQIAGTVNSFNAQLQGTTFFDYATEVGSFWQNIGGVHTVAGAFKLDQAINFAAYRVDVNSCASGDLLNASLSF